MILKFQQRFFSWLDSYDVFDEDGNAVYMVKGVLSWGHCLKIFDAYEEHIGTVKEEILTFLPKFAMYEGDREIGMINKEFTFFIPKFNLDFNGWEVEGDLFEWEYSVMDGNRQVMRVSKKLWNLTDTYELEIHNEEDALYCLMIVLAIDAAKCSQK